jgi:peptide/nickel transport system substrate-binding protein
MRGSWRNIVTICTLTLLVGCAPTAPQAEAPRAEPGTTAPRTPKTLRIGMHRDPAPGIALFDDSGTGSNFNALMFHSGLTWPDGEGRTQPLLAQKVPSIADGDWRVLSDGTMQVTWKLRPGVKWHDGRTLSSEDLMLGMRLSQDPELTRTPIPWLSSISDFSAPDPLTLVLTWKQPYFQADRVLPREIPAVASHIVGAPWERAVQTGDKQAFMALPYWADEWVGLGPYRVVNRVVGSQLEAVAFDDYFLGRPKIDRLFIRYYPDVDSQVLAVMANELDYAPVGAFSTPHVHTLKQQWEPTAAGSVVVFPIGLAAEHFQFGDPDAPWAKDLRIRRAIAHMYDRQAYVDSLEFGTTTVADVVVSPRDPLYKLIEQRGMPRYDYDLNRAQQLMGEAGWTRGADGMYRNAAGNLFDIEMFTKAVTDNSARRIQVSAAMLKQGGLNSSFRTFPFAFSGVEDRRARSTFKGLFGSLTITDEPLTGQQFISSNIRLDAEGVSLGQNVYRYSNPTFDDVYNRYLVTLESDARQNLRAELIRHISDQVVAVPLFYGFLVYAEAIRKNVRGPSWMHPSQAASGWGIHTWELD